MTHRNMPHARQSFSPHFGRDFTVGVLFGVPYGLAVFFQDIVSVAAGEGNWWPAIASAVAAVALIGGGALAWRRRTRRSSAPSTGAPISSDGIDGELSEIERRLATLARWLRRDADFADANEPTRRHFGDLAACAEGIDVTVRNLLRRRSDTTRSVCVHSMRDRPTRIVKLGSETARSRRNVPLQQVARRERRTVTVNGPRATAT